MPKANTVWHIIRTAPQQEFYITNLLGKFGFDDVYTPFERVPRGVNGMTRKKRERRRWMSKPVLRGYVFVKMPIGDHRAYTSLLNALYHLDLIRGLFGAQGAPYAVPDEQIGILKEVYKRGYDKKLDGGREEVQTPEGLMFTGQEFKLGDNVRMYDGPLSEIPAVVTEIHDSQAKILMTIFGIDRLVTAPLIDLRKAS